MKNLDDNQEKVVGEKNDKNASMPLGVLGLQNKIHEIRGEKVMLDSDLAEIYGYETKAP